MKKLFRTILLKVKMRQIQAIDRRYIELNEDLDYIKKCLALAEQQAMHGRLCLLRKRQSLRSQMMKLEGV